MKQLFFISVLFYFSGCTQTGFDNGTAPGGGGTKEICSTVIAESSECSSAISPGTSPVTITGSAQFYKRSLQVTTLASNVTDIVLGAPVSSALPIKYAEVQVLNSSGSVVQCGVTDSNGALKAVDGSSALQIPNSAGTYTVKVLARTNHTLAGGSGNFKIYSSVKSDICSNAVHSVQTSITSNGTGPITASGLTAYARESETSGQIQGGAFNILNNLVATYEYLASNTGTSDLSCLNPKLHIYWQAGFNPAQYIYPDEDPNSLSNISYYLRGYNELYINGGKLGNVSAADTDHFDDAVIIHEIGHRLEDACGKMDSPGGTHNGLFRIDPRLAWSEGWGNFIGAHIFRNKISSINPQASTALSGYDGWLYYLDTEGYKDGSTITGYELIRLNLTKPGNNPEGFVSSGKTYYYDKVDPVANPGEGHFREVSIARALFKFNNTCNATTCTDTNYFSQVWSAFERITTGIGMGKSTYPFRSSVRFYDRLNAVFSGTMPTVIDNVLNTDEAQQRSTSLDYTISGNLTWPAYATKLTPTMSACNLEIRPKNEDATVTNVLSDQRYSDHFYYIDKATSLPSITQISLHTSYVAGTAALSFGLRLYEESYRFESATTNYASSLNVSSLNTSTPYLLNIRAYTAGVTVSSSTRYTYALTTNNPGEYLCPSSF